MTSGEYDWDVTGRAASKCEFIHILVPQDASLDESRASNGYPDAAVGCEHECD